LPTTSPRPSPPEAERMKRHWMNVGIICSTGIRVFPSLHRDQADACARHRYRDFRIFFFTLSALQGGEGRGEVAGWWMSGWLCTIAQTLYDCRRKPVQTRMQAVKRARGIGTV